MKVGGFGKLFVPILFGIGLAVLLTAQAVSGVITARAPAIAVSVMPMNGEAIDRLAFARFTSQVGEQDDPAAIAQSAQSSLNLARKALTYEPLLSRSLTIVGIAQTDIEKQTDFLELADPINRRDISLQGVRLTNQVARKDLDGVFETVDRILRVGPQLYAQFFPVLLVALQEESGIERLAEISRQGVPWLGRFLRYAVRSPKMLDDLAEFRGRTGLGDREFDDLLIAALADRGSYAQAYALYRELTSADAEGSEGASRPLGWAVDHPPFGWKLADESGLRAQLNRRGDGVEINVRPGEAGILAERVIPTPTAPFNLEITHDLRASEQLRYFQAVLHCGDPAAPYALQPLREQKSRISVDRTPPDCEFTHVAIYARVFSGRPSLRGTIKTVRLVRE